MKKWKIDSKEELLKCMACSEAEFIDSLGERDRYYARQIEIPKKNGTRKICEIDKSCRLYVIQKNLKKNYLDNIQLSDAAYGFVKERDYIDYLNIHTNAYKKNNYLRLDITNFFGSISRSVLKKTFEFMIDSDDKDEIVRMLLDVVMHGEVLEQGTPIAPVISNIVFRPIDIRIEKYCEKLDVTYSRYADDLLFSSENSVVLSKRFIKTIGRIISSYEFKINYSKLRTDSRQIALNGYVVSDSVTLSRKKLESIRRVLYHLEKKQFKLGSDWLEGYNSMLEDSEKKHIQSVSSIINYLAGYRSFVINMMKHSHDTRFQKKGAKLITRIEKQILYMERVISAKEK